MKLPHCLTRSTSTDSIAPKKHMPWIKSPLHEIDSNIPIFRKHHESSTLELFYDLLFVANLTTFTANHEIENPDTLGSYIGFFSFLWFTWLQNSLYDVRFSTDSVFSRTIKAFSCGIMTGFAVIGPQFDTSAEAYSAPAFRSMTLILMASRLFLVIQYGVVLWYVKSYKKTFVPLAITIAILFTSAMVFLGLFFSFTDESSKDSYIGWYVVVVVEAIAVVGVSSVWRILSFKYTHLVERNGILTLIILGEGIVGLCTSVTQIMDNSKRITGADVGTITVGVLLVYLLWVLYFDQIEHDRFGTIRQQIWTLLHFPLHVAILLTVEGSSKFITWWALAENFPLFNQLQDYYNTTIVGTDGTAIAEGLNRSLALIEDTLSSKNSAAAFFNFTPTLAKISDLNLTNQEGVPEFSSLLDEIWGNVTVAVFAKFDISEPPEAQNLDAKDQLTQFGTLFDTVFYFFFIAAGCVLIFLGVLYWFGNRGKTRGEIASIVVRAVAGTGLALLTTLHTNDKAFGNYILSPWLIPTVVLTFFVVIVVDSLLVWRTNMPHQSSPLRSEEHLPP